MTNQSTAFARRMRRALLAIAASLALMAPHVVLAQEGSVSFWFRLAPDSTVKADEVAIIDFFPDSSPLVRVHAGLVTGLEIDNLKRTLSKIRRQNRGKFPVGQRLVIARNPKGEAPDTNRADAGLRREVRLLREIEQKAKTDPSVLPVIMTLVVDKEGKSQQLESSVRNRPIRRLKYPAPCA